MVNKYCKISGSIIIVINYVELLLINFTLRHIFIQLEIVSQKVILGLVVCSKALRFENPLAMIMNLA